MIQAELERFFEELVEAVRSRGAVCAITSGMACVHFGVAVATKDCDVLCQPDNSGVFLDTLAATRLRGVPCRYRGHMTAPLDARWLRGGWTAHFLWDGDGIDARLDVFGVAPRASVAWNAELEGLYAGLHTVAEMKRTDREKDWPFATGLGTKLLRTGDLRGWLHIFDHDLLLELAERVPLPPELLARRPVLRLLEARSPMLEVALKAELEFWSRLDRRRLQIYRGAARSYTSAVMADVASDGPDLRGQHQARVEHATRLLAMNPLCDHGLARLAAEAREDVSRFFPATALDWLPDVLQHFLGLGE